jgi:hypothetical protein
MYNPGTGDKFSVGWNYVTYTDPAQLLSFGQHWFNFDPLFVNPAARDFHLQAGSPAIDKGIPVSGLLQDPDGVSRPQGAGWDVGAYEYRTMGIRNPQPEAEMPSQTLLRVYPNPFFTKVFISWPNSWGNRSSLTIHIRNVADAVVRILKIDRCHPGVVWDGKDDAGRSVKNGLYVIEAIAGQILTTRTVLFLDIK